MSGSIDGRKFARFEVVDYALVKPEGSEAEYRSVVVNIGIGGLQLKTKHEIPMGKKCKLSIGRPNQDPMTIPGEVRFTSFDEGSELYSLGFKFIPQNHEERAAIAIYVHEVFMRGEPGSIDDQDTWLRSAG